MVILNSFKLEIKPGFAAMPLDLAKVLPPRLIEIDGIQYRPKSEFHATLIGNGHRFAERLSAIEGLSVEHALSKSTDYFAAAAEGLRFRVVMRPKYYFVKKQYQEPQPHERKSIIARCEIEQADKFYARLTALCKMQMRFDPVPHHVTLLVSEDDGEQRGIGIATELELLEHGALIKDRKHLRLLPPF